MARKNSRPVILAILRLVSLRLGGNSRYSSRRTILTLVSLLQLIFCFCWAHFVQFDACLHWGGRPQIGEVTYGGSPHLSRKRNNKMRLIWTGRLPHLSGLPHLPGVAHLHVNRSYEMRTEKAWWTCKTVVLLNQSCFFAVLTAVVVV